MSILPTRHQMNLGNMELETIQVNGLLGKPHHYVPVFRGRIRLSMARWMAAIFSLISLGAVGLGLLNYYFIAQDPTLVTVDAVITSSKFLRQTTRGNYRYYSYSVEYVLDGRKFMAEIPKYKCQLSCPADHQTLKIYAPKEGGRVYAVDAVRPGPQMLLYFLAGISGLFYLFFPGMGKDTSWEHMSPSEILQATKHSRLKRSNLKFGANLLNDLPYRLKGLAFVVISMFVISLLALITGEALKFFSSMDRAGIFVFLPIGLGFFCFGYAIDGFTMIFTDEDPEEAGPLSKVAAYILGISVILFSGILIFATVMRL